MATAIDTLKIYERLKSADLSDKAAKEIAEVVREAAESVAAPHISEIKTEIKEELSDELSTKADVNAVKADLLLVETRLSGKIETLETRIEAKLKLYFMLLALLFLLANPKAIELLSKLLGLVK